MGGATRTFKVTASSLTLRPVAPTDAPALAALLARVSPESAYRRFHGVKHRLSDAELRYLVNVDHVDHEAIVAVEQPTQTVVGVARYVRRRDDGKTAEVAILVEDRWHGHGVGRTLVRRLAQAACANGVERFTAHLLADNRPALRLFARRRLRHVRDGSTVELEVDVRGLIADEESATPCDGGARSMQPPSC